MAANGPAAAALFLPPAGQRPAGLRRTLGVVGGAAGGKARRQATGPACSLACDSGFDGPGRRTIESCTILTTTANELVRPIHDRMPVIVAPGDYARWLNPAAEGVEGLLELLRPFASGGDGRRSGERVGQQSGPRWAAVHCAGGGVRGFAVPYAEGVAEHSPGLRRSRHPG